MKLWPALLATLVIAGAAIGAFSPALFGGKMLAPLDITTRLLAPWKESANGAKPHNHSPSDAVTQYLPYRIQAEKSLLEDGYIGWNPYSMGGSSLAGNTMALPGSWTMQLHRFLSFEQAWDLGLLAEFLIAGAGMLVFLRSRKLPWLACVLGALVYMGNSQFIIWIHHRWALSSFSWMPWVLWAAADGLAWKNPSRRQWLLPFFITLAFLGCSLQHLVFVGLACGCLFAGGIRDWKSPLREWPAVLCWAVAFGLAVLMAAFTLVPQVQAYLTNIEIGHTRGGIGYPDGSIQPVLNLFAIPAQIWPWLLGDPQTIDAWRLLKSSFMNLAYIGTIPMVLALAGLFVRSMPRQAKWLILAGLLIPLTPLVGPLYHRVQLLFLLGGAWMAAEMLARLPVESPRFLLRSVTAVVAAIGVALLIGTCLPKQIRSSIENTVITKSVAATADSNFGNDPAWIEKRARGWTDRFSLLDPRTAWTYSLLLVGTAGLAFAGKRPRWGNIAIIGASSLELLTLFQTWVTFSDPRDLLPPHPAIEQVRQLAGSSRVMQGFGKTPLGEVFGAPNLLSAYSVRSVEAYESIQYSSVSHTLRNEDPESRLTMAGVGISVQPETLDTIEGTAGWPVVGTASGFTIRKNPTSLAPLLAGAGAVPETADKMLPLLRAASPVQTDSVTMNRWAFSWPDGAKWLRLDQNWHPGWRWRAGDTEWKPVTRGHDGACWILSDQAHTAKTEIRFFPRENAVWTASLAALVITAGLALAGTRLHPR
ncbi:MAG: hypothetical protein EOP88_01585 [Verrucomicrobiaceae bacterium]|nr:MAG: hypothetical protein EOP88_01585 [Verrucomicrobiaceae bacterium]